jgi:molybdopterin adenylyltransferase
LRVAVLTISTSAAAGGRPDASGPLLAGLAVAAGFELAEAALVADDAVAIEAALRAFVAADVEVVLTTGGTGLTPDDVTPEATQAVIERDLPGIAHALMAESLRQTPMGMLSRAACGVAGRTIVVNLPGSPRAVGQLFPVLAPVLGHAVQTLRGSGGHGA